MAPLFREPRARRQSRHPSLLTACNPLTWSNLFKGQAIIPTTEKVDFSVKDEAHLSDLEHERGSTYPFGPVRAEPYHWPHDGRLEPATTALVIIDMQRDFCEDGGYMAYQGYDITPAKSVIPIIQSILSRFREAGYPIYFTREGHRPDLSTLSTREQYRSRNNKENLGIGDRGPLGRLLIRGQPGHNIIYELQPLDNEPIIDKPGRGAFAHTDFELMLSIKGIRNLVICGVTTDVCVTSTLREANDRRFDCILVSDACAAGDAALHEAAIQTVKEEGGIFGSVTTSAELLHALKKVDGQSEERPRHVPWPSRPARARDDSQDTTTPVPPSTSPSSLNLLGVSSSLWDPSYMQEILGGATDGGPGHVGTHTMPTAKTTHEPREPLSPDDYPGTMPHDPVQPPGLSPPAPSVTSSCLGEEQARHAASPKSSSNTILFGSGHRSPWKKSSEKGR